MDNNIDVVGIGAVLIDHTVILPNFPAENQKVVIESYFDQVGGSVPTALIFLGKLKRSIRFISVVGDDHISSEIKRALVKHGLDVEYLITQENKASRFSHVWINKSNGTRTIAYSRGTLDDLKKEDIHEEVIKNARILHLDAREPVAALYAAEIARNNGVTVTFDAGSFKQSSEELLRKAQVVFAPKRFAHDLFHIDDLSEGSKRIREYEADIAIVTDGENGLSYTSNEGTFYQKSFNVKTVDTNGAGDTFSGAFIDGLLSKKSIQESITFAAAAAALKCTRMGKNNLPFREEIEEFIQNNPL